MQLNAAEYYVLLTLVSAGLFLACYAHARLWAIEKKLDALLALVGNTAGLAAKLHAGTTQLETAIATDSPSRTAAGATKVGE